MYLEALLVDLLTGGLTYWCTYLLTGVLTYLLVYLEAGRGEEVVSSE